MEELGGRKEATEGTDKAMERKVRVTEETVKTTERKDKAHKQSYRYNGKMPK